MSALFCFYVIRAISAYFLDIDSKNEIFLKSTGTEHFFTVDYVFEKKNMQNASQTMHVVQFLYSLLFILATKSTHKINKVIVKDFTLYSVKTSCISRL